MTFRPYPEMKRLKKAELEKLFRGFTADMEKLVLGSKLNDYSDPDNCLSNFVAFSWKGVIVTISQKLGRMLQYMTGKEMQIKDQTFMNDCIDIANYMFLAYCCRYAEDNAHTKKIENFKKKLKENPPDKNDYKEEEVLDEIWKP